jgi:hypothetical protein
LALSSCKTASPLTPSLLAQLEADPRGYLAGEVSGLGDKQVLNDRDFVYSIALSPDGARAAYSHLGPKMFQLGLWQLGPSPRLLADPEVNPYQWDLEAVVFAPDGRSVAGVSRDGGVRLFDAASGKLLAATVTDEPLVSLAFHPLGKYLAVGSARGLITVLKVPSLGFAFEARTHEAEVRALEFSANGALYSGSWDKSIAVQDAVEEVPSAGQVRLRFERRGGFNLVRGTLGARASGFLALDARLPYVVVTADFARAAGVDVAGLKDTVTVATPMGQSVVRLARGVPLAFKSMTVEGLDVAVCDVCVPRDAQGVLGEAFTRRFDVAFDEQSQEALVSAKEPAAAAPPVVALVLKPARRFTFDNFVNDLSLDRAGRRLGVAFSEVKAERNRDIYEREKKGLVEPVREGNAGAIVDAETGKELRRWVRHEGVVATAGISPDGSSLATGGWDKRVYVNRDREDEPLVRKFGWSLRRVRFSSDGRALAVAAWTPQNPLGDGRTDASAVLFPVEYARPEVKRAP